MIYAFAGCELDTARRVFRREGAEEHVEPQVFDVLALLVSERGRVVSKETLLDEVWGDRFVSESALTTRIKSARQAVGDDGQRQAVIRTVHGRGYEFVADVSEAETADRAMPDQAGQSAPALPGSVTEIIGRDAVLGELRAALATTRMLTLVGPAGVGKTVLGYELARQVSDAYADGVFAVELVRVVEAGSTLEALATALDVHSREGGSLDDAVIDLLQPKEALLLLDNCEHVIEPVSSLVDRLLGSAPGVSVLATSREPLAVQSEHVWPIEPLPVALDDAAPVDLLVGVPAVALFVDRARAADPRFELTEHNVAAVVEICRRLDGVPLAIELAAARTRAIDVADIASRLDERFRLLKGIRRGADPRHGTLHDAVRWSYDLLTDDEQLLFAALSVFAGQFDLDAAEAVCGADDLDVLDVLTRLAERSMLAVRRARAGGTRYEMLETLREYGRSRLDDDRSVELFAGHARHYAAVCVATERGMQSSDEAASSRNADNNLPDIRAAHRSAMQMGDLDTAYTIVSANREYAMRAMRYEALTWADIEPVGGHDHPLHATVLGVRAYGAWVRGENERALALAQAAADEEAAGGRTPSGLAERVRANLLLSQGEIEEGLAATAAQLELAEASGNRSRVAHASYMHSVAHSSVGDLAVALHYADRAHAAGMETGSPTDLASGFVARGFAATDSASALEAFGQAVELAASARNRWMGAFARTEMSGVELSRGNLPEACRGLADVIDIWFRSGEWAQQWQTLTRSVVALAAVDRPELAAEVVGAIERRMALGAPPVMKELRASAIRVAEELRTGLGEDRYETLVGTGAETPIVDVVHRTRRGLLARV